ncbi:MAG: AAA family ATPase, partial [Pseudonocardiaceae bacterium]
MGREYERRLLGGLVGGLPTGGGAAVIRGEAGVGKTALLDQIAAAAPGRVLWARGVESEAVLPFAVVSDLLVPLQGLFDQLPDVQRDALEISLALKS